jgi:hypothetical protein
MTSNCVDRMSSSGEAELASDRSTIEIGIGLS